MTTIKAWMSLNFRHIWQLTTKLAALECLKAISPLLFNCCWSDPFFDVFKFSARLNQTTELAALEHLKIHQYNGENGVSTFSCLFTNLKIDDFTCWL